MMFLNVEYLLQSDDRRSHTINTSIELGACLHAPENWIIPSWVFDKRVFILYMTNRSKVIQRWWRWNRYIKNNLERNAMFEGMSPPRGLEWWEGGICWRNMLEDLGIPL